MGLYKSECYCTNLRRSANAVSDFYDRELKPSGLTAPQYYLMINLSRLGSANITHWAEHVGLERSTMVRNILDAAIPMWTEAQRKLRDYLGGDDASAILRIGAKLQKLK